MASVNSAFNAADFLVHRRLREGLTNKTAVIGTRSRTYGELSDDVARVAASMRKLGLHTDDRVLFVMADDVDLAISILAAFHAGLVAVPVSTMYSGHELAEIVIDSGARVVMASAEFGAAAAEAVSTSPEVEHLVVSGDCAPQVRDGVTVTAWPTLLDVGSDYAKEPALTGDDAWALWLYTSGTTGSPKAAIHRHANIRHVQDTYATRTLGIREDDVTLSVAKMFFAYGIGNSLFFPLAAGATSLLEPGRPTPATMSARIVKDRPTLFFGVPTFYAALVNSDLPDDTFASVRLCVSAGEPLPAALQKRFLDRFGVTILDGIGSTEVLHIFMSNAPDDIRPGTTGKAVPGYDLEVRDDEGRVVNPGIPGHLYVRGESLAVGYWRRTDANRSVFEGRWVRTGDTYVQDEDGYFHCMGRSNDMLKAGGIWVSPGEVEARLLEHEAVLEAAVAGVPDPQGLDKPVALVVLDERHAAVTEDELIAWCRDGLAAFKRPRRVVFIDALPRTATGKVQRFRVREQLAAYLNAVPQRHE
jgi:benzoate-CoA ligase family protein